VIVVDNGSSDRTADVARSAGATVVSESRPGYGAAVHRGLLAATREIVVVLDGDGSILPDDLRSLVAAVTSGSADLACGSRQPVTRAAWPAHARWGNRVLSGVLSMALGLDLHDIAPVRVARRAALLDLGIVDRRFGYPLETLLRARAAGWRMPGAYDSFQSLPVIQHIARIAERGCFDLLFLGDGLAAGVNDHPSFTARFEPITMLAALAATTTHLGLGATMSTTYEEPFNVARFYASLDHLTGGRAAWNAVTSSNPRSAPNFGRQHPPHDARYRVAEELVVVVMGLWDC
jgi:hypothetical protein